MSATAEGSPSGVPARKPAVVVIPAFDEEQALPSVLSGIHRQLPRMGVIVVDDGSADATCAVARAAGAAVIRLPFNMGIGGALRAGFRHACELGYGAAVQIDADGQHRPDQVPALLAALRDGADMAIGNRFEAAAEGGPAYRVGAVRGAAMAVLRVGVRLLCGQRFRDPTSGFRAVAQPLLGAFAAEYPVEYMDSAEALVAACRAGYRVVEVPVRMERRAGGSASTGPVRLAYHYARLAVALLGGSRRALPRAASGRAQSPHDAT